MNETTAYNKYASKIPKMGFRVCRLCVEVKDQMQRFSGADLKSSELYEIFEEVTKIKLEISNGYPEYICFDCEDNLRTTNDTIKMYKEIDTFWRQFTLHSTGLIKFDHQKDQQNNVNNTNMIDMLPIEELKMEEYLDDDENEILDESGNQVDQDEEYETHFLTIETADDDNDDVGNDKSSTVVKKVQDLESNVIIKKSEDKQQFVYKNLNYECEICNDKAFSTKKSLAMHMRSCKKAKKDFYCQTCGTKCTSAVDLNLHMATHKSFNCAVCSKTFPTKQSLSAHVKTHKPIKIKKDEDAIIEDEIITMESEEQIASTSLMTSPQELTVFSCTACSETFSDKMSFRDHVRSAHLSEQKSNCPRCQKVCYSDSSLKKHMQKRHGILDYKAEKKFECEHCPKTFRYKSYLEGHMKTHTQPEKYICDICGHEFKSLNSVNRHSQLHQGPDGTIIPIVGRSKTHTSNKCPLCSKAYARLAPLRDHMRTAHPFEGPLHWEQILLVACMRCNETYDTVEMLNAHKDTHSTFQCNICKQPFTSQESLSYHLRCHSDKERPHKCMICEATYLSKNHLSSHIRRAHTKERPHVCILCSKAFSENYELVKHTRLVHIKDRSFKCPECDKTFKKNMDLKVHLQRHTGIFRYKCEICNKGFRNSTQFLGHNLAKHPTVANPTLMEVEEIDDNAEQQLQLEQQQQDTAHTITISADGEVIPASALTDGEHDLFKTEYRIILDM